MALLSTYQKFKEKNAQGNQGGQSEPQKQETQKESSGSGLMSTYQQFMSKKQGGTQAVSPAQDYNQRVWDVLQRVDSANASRNGGWSADVTGGNSLEINALLREYDAYEGDKSGMTDYRNMLLGYNKQMQELNGYYSKFRDSDDYDRQRSGYENFGVGYSPDSWGLSDSEAREIRKQQSQKDAQESQRALAEYTAAKKEFERVDSEWRTMDDRYRSFTIDEYDKDLTEKWQAAKKRMTDAKNSLLGARNRMDAYNATWGKIDQYAGDAAAAKGTDTTYRGVSYDELTGWENKRQEEQTAQEAQAMTPGYAPGTLKYTTDTEPQVDDALGLWRSMTQQQRQDAASSSNGQLSKLANEGAASYWDLLTDDEVSTYYYIRNQRGQEAANRYLDDMYIELTRRNEAGMVQDIENASALEKTGMVAASVGANLLGAIPAAMGTTADLIAGRKNPYSSSGLFKRYASYVRGTVGQDISDWTEDQLADKYGEAFAAKAGELANQTFQALMSGADSFAGGMFFGQGLGIPVGPFDMHVGGYTTVMGLGAFADRAQEMQLKGATTAQIALGAIGSGVLEALFEDVSMEAFFTNILDNPATTLKEFTKKLAVQMGVEASEEVFTEIGNILWDGIVMGKNSDTETATREYMSQGMTEQEARQRATLDNIQDIVWAGYGGAISAGAMAAGGQALSSGVNRVHSTVGNYAVGSQLLENGRAVDLQEQAASLTNEKKRAKLQKAAAEVASNTSTGDKSFRNTYRTGKVATQIAQQAGREARSAETAEFRKAAEKYLEGQRGIQNKKHALNVLTRAYDGTAMLPGDKAYMRMIGGEKLTQEILNSVGGKETLQENARPSVEASMRTIGNVQSSVLGIAPETKAEFDSDNSGQAFRKSDSEPINILSSEPIARVENGVLYLNTDDGQEIAASDVSYGNSGEAAVYAAISNMQTDTETARSLLNGIDDSGLSSAAYARAIQNAYYRGMNGVKFEDTPGYSDAAKLPEAHRRAAWEAGKQRRAAKVREQSALIDSGKAGTRESGVTMQESAKSIRSLNKQQQTGMAAAKALAAAGLHVEVYASTEAERKAGKPNGIYRKADGSIAIDLNAGDNGQGTVAYALAHETTHFIQDYAPAKFETYAELIIAAAESKGISYDSLLARQLARLSEMEEYKNLSETELQEIAYDETIAEMSETILTDTDAASRLSQQIYKQDRTLWQKIKDFFTGLVEKLRSAYRGSDPDSDIGRMLKRAVQDNAEIAQAWAEAVSEAGENYQLQDGTGTNAGEDSSIRLSPREQATARTLVEQLEEHLQELSQMEAVAEVHGTELNKELRPVDAAMEFVNSFGGSVTREGFGVVRFSKTKIKSGLVGHGLGNAKMETFAAVPAVIRNGVQIGHADNWKDSHKESFVFAAPVTYRNAKSYVGVIVERDSQSGMYYVHEVVDNNGNVFAFDSKKEESAPDRLLTLSGRGDTVANSSENMVTQDGANVNGGNVRKSSRNVRDSEENQTETENFKKWFSDRNSQSRQVERLEKKTLEEERQRSAAAIQTMKDAQRAIDIARKGLWEAERREIKQSYDRQMKKLREQYSEDTGTMQKEFFRLLREYEKQQAKGDRQSAKDSDTISALREALSKEAQSHKEDSAAWNKEFSRLLREYETSGRKVDRLEAKVKQQREAAAQKVESRKKTEERHKLQNTIDTLNKYLLQPTNTAHVPQGLQSSVAMALRAINGVIGDSKAAQNADRLAEYAYRLRELEKNPSANGDKIADLNRKIQNLTGKDSSMKAALAELQEQYHKLETQGNNLYDSNIEALIQNTMEQIGDTEYRNLSLQQLKAVRDSYTALLTTIRNANKAFVAGKNARIDEMVQRATTDLSLMKKKNPNQTAIGRNIDQFFWNNEKPVYAFERIGSAVMSELYDNLRKGEDTFYRDVSQARDFFLESAEKNGFSKWDLNELKEFTAADGRKFQLSLDELMSLYAYSLRPQAREHLTRGGIVLGENTKRFTKGPLGVTRETTYNDANAYTLTDETIDAIAGSLTKEQRQFAFEMQQYLAKIMGAKGDEVNMAMYGIKKFGEETYWPLKSSDVFSERVRAQQDNPGNKLKNKGFTKALTPKANNAIELSTLTETWAEHVSDMSMYHSFTLPMEDFYRVYNWNQRGDSDGKRTMGVRQMIQQTAGKGAVTYIDQFLKDLNGGLRADPRETVSKAMLSGFKKAAVSASLSVAIQQPSAVGRALAYIEPKYFIGSKVEGTKFAETWEQLKKYAAVAGLKEMGRFDVDMGKSTLEYIIGRNGLSTWGKITDKVDEYSGWLPEMADQVTWCAIWEAAKRKTKAQNPGLHGEALLQKAGELFTDTITRTQVYDSVFSRSANMRAKSGLMSMATAFMAEPTTTANMVEDAIRKFQKGDKRMSAKMLSSVAVATVLNAALAAVVYAARDDDKDKTYWEKYLASLAGETADSFNPLTYVPIVADINNLLMGYSIERTDMSLATDLVTALKKIFTLYQQYDDDWDEDKKKEWNQKVKKAWFDNVLMAGTVTGLPLKNIYRDVKAAVNVITKPSNGVEMSADTILNAMLDSAKKSLPVVSWIADESSSDQLYKAITQGKTVLAKRLKAQFKNDAAYESAVLKGLRENDPRITQAAQYLLDKNTPKRVAIIKQIVAEGHYTQDQVIKAINQKANSMKEKSTGSKQTTPEKLYDYSEYVSAAANGLGYAEDVREEMISYQADRNQEKDSKLTRQQAEEDAQNTFRSGVKKETKDGYSIGELTEEQVRKALLAVGYWDKDDVEDILLQWNTELTLGGEIDWSDSKYLEYAQEIEPAGISAEIYDEWLRAVDYELKGEDADGDGKIDRYSAIKQKAAYINALPLTAEQKDALFATVTDSAKTRRKYKLW